MVRIDRNSITAMVMGCAFPAMGWLLDRFSVRLILCFGAILQVASVFALVLAQTSAGAALYGVLFGLAGGTTMACTYYVWPTYFGRRHMGAIHGSARTVSIVGAAAGPLLVDLMAECIGSYSQAIMVLCVLPADRRLDSPTRAQSEPGRTRR
jgi:MFS family permease